METVFFTILPMFVLIFPVIVITVVLINRRIDYRTIVLKKVKKACQQYENHDYYKCPVSKRKIVRMVVTNLILAGVPLFLLLTEPQNPIIVFSIIASVILLRSMLIEPNVIKIKEGTIVVKSIIKAQKEYDLNDVGKISYSESRNRTVFLSIKEVNIQKPIGYKMAFHHWTEIEAFIFLVNAVKNKKLNDISNMTAEDMLELRRKFEF